MSRKIKEDRVFVVALGNLHQQAQKAISDSLNPEAFANFFSTPDQAIAHIGGFEDAVLLGICAKRATQVIFLGSESMPEEIKRLEVQVARRVSQTLDREVRFSHALWNGSVQIPGHKEVIEVPHTEHSGRTCVACIDCRTTTGIELVVKEMGGDISVLRIPGAGLQESEKSEASRNPFMMQEIALAKLMSPKGLHVLNHEGCIAFPGGRSEIQRAGVLWANHPGGFRHQLACVGREDAFTKIVTLT